MNANLEKNKNAVGGVQKDMAVIVDVIGLNTTFVGVCD